MVPFIHRAPLRPEPRGVGPYALMRGFLLLQAGGVMRKLMMAAVLYSDAYLRPAARHSAALNTTSLISITSDAIAAPDSGGGTAVREADTPRQNRLAAQTTASQVEFFEGAGYL